MVFTGAPGFGGWSSGIRAHATNFLWGGTFQGAFIDLESGFLTVEPAAAKGRQIDKSPVNPILVDAVAGLKKTVVNESVFVNRFGPPHRSIRTAFENAFRHAKLADVTILLVRWAHSSVG